MVNVFFFFELISHNKYFLLTDFSSNIQSDSVNSTNQPINHHQKSHMIVQYQQTSAPRINIPDGYQSDESEITITRL